MLRITVIIFIYLLFSCGTGKMPPDSHTITIFHAGSLSYPLREIIKAFNQEFPDVKVLTESSGSIAGARKITDLNRICDLYISADYKVIEKLLYPEQANWHVAFARNEMAVVFNEKSKYANEINSVNWTQIMLREGVRFGRSDPNADPCGYRTLMMWQLAARYYNLPGLYHQLLSKDSRFIRPKEVDLLALLETNTVDYIFLYRSLAMQHGLMHIALPDSINLGNPLLNSHFKQVKVEVRGTSPEETFSFYGEPMVYAVTIPIGAPNQKLAETFLDFLLNPEKGLRIMEQNGQPALLPPKCDNPDNAPAVVRKYLQSDQERSH